MCNALNDLRSSFYIEFATGEVVQKEQWFSTLHQNIIHTHGNQVDTNRCMACVLECQFEFRTHSVCSGYQYRLPVFSGNLEQRAKTADSSERFRAQSASCEGFDYFDQTVACININTGCTIGNLVLSESVGLDAVKLSSRRVKTRVRFSKLILP